jgi:hypothetical protein
LVSADAIASDYFYDKEVADALERHRQGSARVVPMIVRPCAWKTTPLADLQALPKDGKPVTSWSDRDEAFTYAAEALWDMVHNILQQREEKIGTGPPRKRGRRRGPPRRPKSQRGRGP